MELHDRKRFCRETGQEFPFAFRHRSSIAHSRIVSATMGELDRVNMPGKALTGTGDSDGGD